MISVILITQNEEEVLEDALKSLEGFADELIVVDSDSVDKTVEIARSYRAKVIKNKLASFSEQRNIGFENTKGNWIFYLDADERITSEFKKEALSKISSYNPHGKTAGFFVRRETYYFGEKWGFTDQVQRLFYREKFKEWYGVVHETPRVEGEFEVIHEPILHFTHRNLSQMIEKTNKWSDYEADLRHKAHHPEMTWWRFPRVMVAEFFRSYALGGGYKNGTKGLIESMYQAFSIFITYAKLWEIQNKR